MPATATSAAPITKVMEMVRSTSTPSSAAMVWSCSQARMSGPRHQPGEQRQQHDGGDDDHDLDVGELHDEAAAAFMQGVAAGDDRRHRLDARALRYLRVVDQHE